MNALRVNYLSGLNELHGESLSNAPEFHVTWQSLFSDSIVIKWPLINIKERH